MLAGTDICLLASPETMAWLSFPPCQVGLGAWTLECDRCARINPDLQPAAPRSNGSLLNYLVLWLKHFCFAPVASLSLPRDANLRLKGSWNLRVLDGVDSALNAAFPCDASLKILSQISM